MCGVKDLNEDVFRRMSLNFQKRRTYSVKRGSRNVARTLVGSSLLEVTAIARNRTTFVALLIVDHWLPLSMTTIATLYLSLSLSLKHGSLSPSPVFCTANKRRWVVYQL
ncbi:hypothetical protein HanIR_Chr12g0602591 [Helianthus annuus]|nr:hypothetical protein HanIR_Chr12g0602591 [Helianthus annuus]